MALDPDQFEPGTDEWFAAVRELPREQPTATAPMTEASGSDQEASLAIDEATIDAWLAPVRLLSGAPAVSVPLCRKHAASEIRNHVARLRGAGWTVTPPALPGAVDGEEGQQP